MNFVLVCLIQPNETFLSYLLTVSHAVSVEFILCATCRGWLLPQCTVRVIDFMLADRS